MDKSRKLAGYGLAARASFTSPDFPSPKPDFTQQLIQLDVNALSISISADEVKRIEAITEPVRQSVKEPYSKYRPSQNNGDQDASGSVSMAIKEKIRQLSARFGRWQKPGFRPNDAGDPSLGQLFVA